MAVYIELTTEPFDEAFSANAEDARLGGAGLTAVRRPLRGLEVKEDTYAYIKMLRVDNTPIRLFDSSAVGGTSEQYANFLLQSVQDQRMERHQVVETFGDSYLFVFGDAPRFLQIQAVLLNSHDFNWKAEFLANYETYLRGTKCVEMGARTYLFYDQNIVEGYILNAQLQETSDNPLFVTISFQMFVTNSSNISLIGPGSDVYPLRMSATLPEGFDPRGVPAEGSDADAAGRMIPLRGNITDNVDEYTTATQAPPEPATDPNMTDVDNLEAATKDMLDTYVAQEGDEYSTAGSKEKLPETTWYEDFIEVASDKMRQLGLTPTFLPNGIGIGSGMGRSGNVATFGATPAASSSASYGVSSGTSAFSGSFSGVGSSAFSGSYAGSSTFSSNGVTTRSSYSSSFNGVTTSYSSSYYTSRSGDGYAASYAVSSSRAGGYAQANASLGFQGVNAIQPQWGASIPVTGRVTAFALTSMPGQLQNVGVSPRVALQGQQQQGWSWSDQWTWP